jgi:hypothetical protein
MLIYLNRTGFNGLCRAGVTLHMARSKLRAGGGAAGERLRHDPPYAAKPPSPTTAQSWRIAAGWCSAIVAAAAARVGDPLNSECSARRLYRAPDAVAGLRVHRVPARRAINSRAAGRGVIDELLITNSRRAMIELPPGRMLRAGLRTARRRRA